MYAVFELATGRILFTVDNEYVVANNEGVIADVCERLGWGLFDASLSVARPDLID